MTNKKNKRKTRSDKIVFQEPDIKRIENLSALGLTLEEIASVFNVSADTLYRRCKEKDSSLTAALLRGKSRAIIKVAKKAYELAIEGNTSMIKYILSCKGGWIQNTQLTVETKAVELDKQSCSSLSFEQKIKFLNREELKKVSEYNKYVIELEKKYADVWEPSNDDK